MSRVCAVKNSLFRAVLTYSSFGQARRADFEYVSDLVIFRN